MAKPVIRVENLGKKYLLKHQEKERYVALRDVIGRGAKSLVKEALSRSRLPSSQEEFWALKEVSFSVQPGEVIGVIGRNGAGKSTLLKILSRITEPTIGRVTLRGRVASLLEVGTGFHPELTGRENVFLSGAVLGMTRSEIRQRFDEIVSFAEVERFVDTPVKRYSSGMYVRLAFAVAAHLEPEILLVDEVLAVGDAAFQQKCLGKMGEVADRQGRTILFVSHNMPTIQRLCGSVVLLHQGQIKAFGPASEITQRYLQQGIATALSWQRSRPPATETYFERLYLSDERGQPLAVVTTASLVQIVADFVLDRPRSSLQLSLDLLDYHGTVIFASAPQDVGLEMVEAAGTYRATIALPLQILLPKHYGVRVTLWHPTLGILDRVEELRFGVQETASWSNDAPGERAGAIALRCDWRIEPYTAPALQPSSQFPLDFRAEP